MADRGWLFFFSPSKGGLSMKVLIYPDDIDLKPSHGMWTWSSFLKHFSIHPSDLIKERYYLNVKVKYWKFCFCFTHNFQCCRLEQLTLAAVCRPGCGSTWAGFNTFRSGHCMWFYIVTAIVVFFFAFKRFHAQYCHVLDSGVSPEMIKLMLATYRYPFNSAHLSNIILPAFKEIEIVVLFYLVTPWLTLALLVMMNLQAPCQQQNFLMSFHNFFLRQPRLIPRQN